MARSIDLTPSRTRDTAPADTPAPEGGVTLDLLRADLYRLLDEVARARGASREARVAEFEHAWHRFKQAMAG